jgi:hypothetical protein
VVFPSLSAVVDCAVSAWGPWSECDVECGTGMMTRSRTVEKQPENGGKHCPSLIQKRGCQGSRCPHNPRSAIKGKFLPPNYVQGQGRTETISETFISDQLYKHRTESLCYFLKQSRLAVTHFSNFYSTLRKFLDSPCSAIFVLCST